MIPPTEQRGSATLVTLVAVVLAAGLLSGVARLGEAAHLAARADAVADLTALAAVGGGRQVADQVVSASGGVLVDLVVLDQDRVRVTVGHGGLSRTAAARSVIVGADGQRHLGGG